MHVVYEMYRMFDASSSCDKRLRKGSSSVKRSELVRRGGCSLQCSLLSWRHRLNETAFPAGNNNLTVVCCHGISTKMLFLSQSLQQSRVAHESVDLTLCLFF